MALRRNILLFHAGALGDFILTWPLAIALGRLFPQSRLYYVTHGQKGALAETVLRVESADIENGWHALFAADPKLTEPSAKLLAGAHTVVSFLSDSAGTWAGNVRALAPDVNLVELSAAAPREFSGHVTDYITAQFHSLPAWESAVRQILLGIQARGLPFPRPGAGTVFIHPGSGSPAKCWHADLFLDLASALRSRGLDMQFLLGEVERDLWEADLIDRFNSAGRVNWCEGTLQLLGHLRRASAFIGNDSGPGHLAGILGIPTLSLFGPMDPVRWKALGPRVRAMPGPLEHTTVEGVLREFEQL